MAAGASGPPGASASARSTSRGIAGTATGSSSRSTAATTTGSSAPRPSLHVAGLRRRRHGQAHGAPLRAFGVGVRLLPFDARVREAARPANRVLQRQAQHLPGPRRGRHRTLARDEPVRPRPRAAQHRHHLRELAPGEGPRRARPQDAPGPAREGASAARHRRHGGRQRVPAGVHAGLQRPVLPAAPEHARRPTGRSAATRTSSTYSAGRRSAPFR